jgi:hypothetical protein
MTADYRHLRVDRLIETAEGLASRVIGRFPEAGLGKVAAAVADVTRAAVETAEWIRRPNWWLRIGLSSLALVVILAAAAVALEMPREGSFLTWLLDFMRRTQGAAVYLGAVVVFFWTLETRFKRAKAMRAIHELRALAHIIDMHQLSKDPDCGPHEGDTTYTKQAMMHYLHYCTELLALISKIGQLYVEDFPDGTTLAAVDQFENLATGLSRKIWQKIMILERVISEEEEQVEG